MRNCWLRWCCHSENGIYHIIYLYLHTYIIIIRTTNLYIHTYIIIASIMRDFDIVRKERTTLWIRWMRRVPRSIGLERDFVDVYMIQTHNDTQVYVDTGIRCTFSPNYIPSRFICIYLSIYIYICVCICYIHTHMHIYIYIHTVYIYIYIYIYIHIHIYIYKHANIQHAW